MIIIVVGLQQVTEIHESTIPSIKKKYTRKKSIKEYKQKIDEEKKRKTFADYASIKISRHYKEILAQRILDVNNARIKVISKDEIFVKLIDYKNVRISNYGRIISIRGRKYFIRHKRCNKDGEVIQGASGLRKIRMPTEYSGKRSRGRVIYLDIEVKECIYLLNVYAKNERTDLRDKEKKLLKKLVKILKEE